MVGSGLGQALGLLEELLPAHEVTARDLHPRQTRQDDRPQLRGLHTLAVDQVEGAPVREQRLSRVAQRGAPFLEEYAVEPVGEPVDVPDADTCSRIGPAPGPAHSPPDDVRATEPHKTTNVSVPWRGHHGYETSTMLPLTPHNTVTHCHDQLLKHGPREGGSTVHVSIPVARDHFCSQPQPGCGQAQAQPGSPVAGLLGGPERNDPVVALDHERIPEVLFTTR